jgi:hypothetical protein
VRARVASIAAATLAALAAAPAAAPAADLPVGSAHGVRVRASQGAVVVVFTSRARKLYRRIAGRKITVSCTDLPERESLAFTLTRSYGSTWRAPKRRRPLHTLTIPARRVDFCRVWLERKQRELIVSIPVTQPGAVVLDEEARAGELDSLLQFAGIVAERSNSTDWPTADELFAAEFNGRRVADFWPRTLVELDGPADAPPAGAIGYYSDGGAHVAVAIVSASGRRLYVELDEDDVIRTNVARYLYDEPE